MPAVAALTGGPLQGVSRQKDWASQSCSCSAFGKGRLDGGSTRGRTRPGHQVRWPRAGRSRTFCYSALIRGFGSSSSQEFQDQRAGPLVKPVRQQLLLADVAVEPRALREESRIVQGKLMLRVAEPVRATDAIAQQFVGTEPQ